MNTFITSLLLQPLNRAIDSETVNKILTNKAFWRLAEGFLYEKNILKAKSVISYGRFSNHISQFRD